jgi:hypothetical protein
MIRAVLKHLQNWTEGYLWVPGAFVLIIFNALVLRLITGRAPQENMSWLVDASGKFVVCIYIILLASIMREATGVWLTKDERMTHPWLAIAQGVFTCFFVAVFAFVFSR